MTERTSPETETLREAVATELIAHGEFSSTGNNYSNALIAADAVIAIVQSRGHAPIPAVLIPMPEQIEPILDDYLGVDCPHYEELRRRCAQRIFDLCVVMSGAPIQSNNRIASTDTSTLRPRTIDDVPSCGQENDYQRAAPQIPPYFKYAQDISDRAAQPQSRDEIARIIDPEAMGLAHNLGRPDLALTAEMQERIRMARAKADAVLAHTS